MAPEWLESSKKKTDITCNKVYSSFKYNKVKAFHHNKSIICSPHFGGISK
jgi:hypothetical protein